MKVDLIAVETAGELADSVERLTRELAEARDALDACARLVHDTLTRQARNASTIEQGDVLRNALAELMPRIRTCLDIANLGNWKPL
jgi:hypothetical protein